MTLILVSENGQVKRYRRFAKMPLTGIRSERPWKPATWHRNSLYLTESLPTSAHIGGRNFARRPVDPCQLPEMAGGMSVMKHE
jgi:hypothetical protein